MTETDEEYEYRVIGWRNFEKESISAVLDNLLANGWELDGDEYVKAGMLVDLTNQRLRRRVS